MCVSVCHTTARWHSTGIQFVIRYRISLPPLFIHATFCHIFRNGVLTSSIELLQVAGYRLNQVR